MVNILIVEDDEKMNHVICSYLDKNGYHVVGCTNPAQAYETLYDGTYDMIISDIMMPHIDGFEFAETVRSLNRVIPILFISARDDLEAKQKGFRLGIDDYMVKPLDMEELVLRVGALLRRANIVNQHQLVVGGLTLNEDEMSAVLNGEDISLSGREFHILYKLLSYPKKIFTRSQLIDEFSGIESETGLRTVDVYVTKLRDKFSACEDFEIVTIRGFGYKAVIK